MLVDQVSLMFGAPPTLRGPAQRSPWRFVPSRSPFVFDIGDKVVYPHHGAAIVERRRRCPPSARSASTSCCGWRTGI